MNKTEISALWLGCSFLEKFKLIGESINSDIEALKRLEKIRDEMKNGKKKA